MIYITNYNSPIGKLLLAAKEEILIGLWIEKQKYYLGSIKEEMLEKEDLEIFIKTKEWLDRYFNKEKPNISELKLNPLGTDFQKRVWKILCEIPYGEVTTYKEIAEKIAKEIGRNTMSCQAVGNAVSHNPISIIIPCHRVIGSNKTLTGYAGGVDKKEYLLKHEGVSLEFN